ncbi:MAG TPA: hypothetical protein VD999_00955 [Vitreimonas sp.]|nr:hypothetical protein [Vitreimonas sp.]
MKVVEKLSDAEKIRDLTTRERELGLKILQTNLAYQPGERILIVTDTQKRDQAAAVWFESAKLLPKLGGLELITIDDMLINGEEPPAEVIAAGKTAHILLLHTTKSLTHTGVSKTARAGGAKVASLPGVSYEIMMQTLTLEYQPIRELGEQLKAVVEKGTTLTVTSPAGTHLTANIRQNWVENDCGFVAPGEITNLPAGEIFFAPLEGTTTGTWVVDGSIASDTLDEPIVITIEAGRAVNIEGGAAAGRLQATLEKVGPLAFSVAEIGIGTNSSASGTASLIEAEKAAGTAHLALGNNSVIGGSINVPVHIDGVTLSPTIAVDGRIILENQRFII